MKRIFIFLLIILFFLSGCARTVTIRPKGLLKIQLEFYNPLSLYDGGNYYSLVIPFNKDGYVSNDLSTWQYFIWCDGDRDILNFKWGKNGDLSTLQLFSLIHAQLKGEISEDKTTLIFQIPLIVFGGSLSKLYMKIYLYKILGSPSYIQGLADLLWSVPQEDIYQEDIYIDLTNPISGKVFYEKYSLNQAVSYIKVWLE
uniref:Lipoprotein n=1 Tax=Dictyoglomus thermophilum TaxID=14 RepID=A0A7C3MIN5_DICTH